MILHTLVWESRTTPRFIWKASASAEAFSFTLPLPDPLGTTASALSPSFHDSPLVPSGRGIPVGGRYEITTRGALYAYPRPPVGLPTEEDARGVGRCGINRYLSVFSPSFHAFPLVPSGRGKGACYGGVAPPSRPLSKPPNHPPYLALRLSEQAGAHIHPRMRGGMKSGQGIPLRAYPGPPSEGLPGCGHDLRTPKPLAGPYGGKGVGMTWGLGVPLHAIPCRQVRVFRKRSFCWNTRTSGGRGDVRL